jgi:transposase-like protein
MGGEWFPERAQANPSSWSRGRPVADERKQHEPSVNDTSQESVAPKMRRQFTASEKLRLVKAADAALASGERGALEALLRKEGIYSSQLATWRQQLPRSRPTSRA